MTSNALQIAVPSHKQGDPSLSENLAGYANFIHGINLAKTFRLTINLFIQEHLFALINTGGLSQEQIEALDRFHEIIRGKV
ncbi:MAG: hypothetical protein ACXWQO_07970 [Bdellovibrionota bacterium]